MKVVAVLILIVLVSGCDFTHHTVVFSDLSTNQSQTIQVQFGSSVLVLDINGETDADGVIEIDVVDTLSSSAYEIPIRVGKIDTTLRYDWYHKECVVRYKPKVSTNGTIKVKLRFY